MTRRLLQHPFWLPMLGALAALFLLPCTASAQTSRDICLGGGEDAAMRSGIMSPDEIERHYQIGMRLLEEEHRETAIDMLREVVRQLNAGPTELRRAGRAVFRAVFSLARALAINGDHLESYECLGWLRASELSPRDRARVEHARQELHPLIAHLGIIGLPRDRHVNLNIDGIPYRDVGARPWFLQTDLGSHQVQIRVIGCPEFEIDVDVRRPNEDLEYSCLSDEGGESIDPTPWIVTGVAAAVAAAVVTALAVGTSEEISGNGGFVIELGN